MFFPAKSRRKPPPASEPAPSFVLQRASVQTSAVAIWDSPCRDRWWNIPSKSWQFWGLFIVLFLMSFAAITCNYQFLAEIEAFTVVSNRTGEQKLACHLLSLKIRDLLRPWTFFQCLHVVIPSPESESLTHITVMFRSKWTHQPAQGAVRRCDPSKSIQIQGWGHQIRSWSLGPDPKTPGMWYLLMAITLWHKSSINILQTEHFQQLLNVKIQVCQDQDNSKTLVWAVQYNIIWCPHNVESLHFAGSHHPESPYTSYFCGFNFQTCHGYTLL